MAEEKNRNQNVTFENLEQKSVDLGTNATLEEIREALRGKKVYITPYAHCDWAWSHSRNWHYARYNMALDEVLDLMAKDPNYTWYVDSWITNILPYLKARPERIQDFAEAVRRGQMAICGDYSNTRTNMVADEAMVRNMVYGKREIAAVFPEAELTVNSSYVDVAIGGPQMPQLLKKSGYKYYRVQRPFDVLYNKGIPHDFIWKGSDGSEVLCWWGSYGGWWTKELAELDFKNDWDGAVRWIWEHEFPKLVNLNCSDVIISANGADDSRPLRSHNADLYIDLPGIIQKWNENETSTLQFSTPVQAFKELEKNWDNIKVVEGTIDPCDVPYNPSWGGERGLLQTRVGGAEALVRAEKWMTAAEACTDFEYRPVDEEWKENLKISAHASQDIFEWDFNEYKRWGDQAWSSAENKGELAVDALARNIKAPANTVAIVFNPHNKVVTRLVDVVVPADNFEDLRLFDGLGNPVPYQIETPLFYNDTWECYLRCLVTLPAMGYTCIVAEGADLTVRYTDKKILGKVLPQLNQPASESFEIDNGSFVFSFDKGDLVSILRKEDGKVLGGKDGCPWNRVSYNHCNCWAGVLWTGPVTDVHPVVWDSWTMKLNGPVVWEVELKGSDGEARYTQTLTITKDSCKVDVKTATYWDHEGFLTACIPMPKQAPLYGGVMFGMEYKDIENEKYDPLEEYPKEYDMHRIRKGLFYAKNVSFYRADGYTAALSNTEGDFLYIKNNDVGQLEYMLVNSVVRESPDGGHTWKEHVAELSMCAKGDHCFRYSFMVYGAEEKPARILSDAAALREKPVVRRVPGFVGKDALPAHASLLNAQDDSVFVSAFYRDGEDIILRVFDTAGEAARSVKIDLPVKPLRAVAQDFLGNADCSKQVTINGNSLTVEVGPFEIVTLRLKTSLPIDRIG